MKRIVLYLRPGTSLVELLMFMAIFALCAGVLIGILSVSGEQRVRQQAISSVEQEGAQLVQTLSRKIRNAEKILYPPVGEIGSVLALQFANHGD